MNITLNGKSTNIPDGGNVADLIENLKLDGPVAAQVNEEIIHRDKLGERRLNPGDKVELFVMMGGG
ncbi:MAG TPA: sulfur carrier protein ThiS [Nitrospirae bacterium]|nr:sulfur carrier protein ThiS [Nitrospirota bacterium]